MTAALNSRGKLLTGFEWTYKGSISTSKRDGYRGQGVSRTLFLYPTLAEIPAQLFAVKVSQSPNQALAGKTVFRFFSFRIGNEGKHMKEAPAGITMDTPLEEIKAIVVSKLANIADVQVSLAINMKGKFATLTAAGDRIKLYDENEPKFQNSDPKKNGDAPYYIKKDTPISVTLTGATSNNNEYLRTNLSTELPADAVLARRATSKIWGEEDEDEAVASPEAAPVW